MASLTDDSRPITNGVNFDPDSGKLYWFGYEARRRGRGILVARAWPAQAWFKPEGGSWSGIRPDFGLYAPSPPGPSEQIDDPRALAGFHQRTRNFQAWLDTIPPAQLAAARSVPEGQFAILSMLSRCGLAALELMQSTPSLGQLLAHTHRAVSPGPKWPLRSIRACLPKRQRDICRYLGFGHSQRVVKLLRKVDPAASTILNLLELRKGVVNRPDVLDRLAHVPTLNAGHMYLVGAHHEDLLDRVGDRFLLELAALPSRRQQVVCVRELRDTCRMQEQLGVPPRVFTSSQQVHRDHERLIGDFQDVRLLAQETVLFPPPPFPGIPEHPFLDLALRPLATPEEVHAEGREMGHCVFSYARNIRDGRCYIYTMLAPERCTIELLHRRAGWVVGQVAGPCNRQVMASTRSVVTEWLRGEQAPRNLDPTEIPF